MSNSIRKTSLIAVLTLLWAVSSAVAQSAPQTSPQPAPKPASAPQSGSRTTPAAPTDSAETKPAVPIPPVESQGEPKAEAISQPVTQPSTEQASEETSKHPKVEATPTPADKLREQLRVAEEMAAAGMKREAIAELAVLSGEDRFDPQGFYNIANALARLDATDAAIITYRKAIEQRKGHYSRASNNLGVVLLRQGFWDQAYEAFIAALRAENFHYAEASYNLGRLYAARGEMELATREWHRALLVNPKHEGALRALAGTENVSDSQPVSSSPAVKTGDKELSRSAPVQNEKTRAAGPSGSSLKVDPETYASLQRARTAHERGRYEEAVASFRSVIKRMGGYFPPANLELSYSLIELRRNDEAIDSLLLVAQKDGARLPISYYHLGRLYELRGDLKQAEDYYARAAQSYQGENSQFLLNLSGVRERRGDFSGALAAMEDYIKRKEQRGQKPEWSDARLANLREKVAAAHSPKP